jgi:protein O-GlcNAc transferase
MSGPEVFRRALSALQAGEVREAERLFKEVVSAEPKHVAALNLLTILLIKVGRHKEAEIFIRRALNESATSDASFYNYGVILKALGRPAEALGQFSKALKINPAVAETWMNRGTVFRDLHRYNDAIDDFDEALSLNMNYAEAFYNKGNVLADLKHYDNAFAAYDRALSLKPDLAEAWLGQGNVYSLLKQYDKAFAAYDRALSLKPDLTDAWLGQGNVCTLLKQYDKAFAAYDWALSLKPDLAEAWLGRGNVYTLFKQYDKAFTAYDRALSLKPDLAEAWLGRGNVLLDRRQYTAALAAYDSALGLAPNIDFAAGARLLCKLYTCDWTNLAPEVAHLLAKTTEPKPLYDPFVLLALSSSSASQLQCAKRYVADRPRFPRIWQGEIYSHDRIRVAYLSADFGEHPVARLLVGLLERHDRSHFEVTAISFGVAQNSPLRQRIVGAVDHFIDVADHSDEEVAALIRAREIDIAVDLMGFTENSRPDVLARRPAPIHISYLGFIGTTGASYIDYVIGDEVALPFDQQPFFSEKIVHLPDCFLPTDDRCEVAPQTPSREEAGLPPEGFIFCSFNNSYKLNQPMFEAWMRLLQAVPGSVLWLTQSNREMVDNLRCQAEQCGADRRRIIFAPHLPYAQHLARQRLAGLFVDTTPYNAGATAAAALWAGLPVVTCLGETFVGRMAASMLYAVGLRELVTSSLAEYEELAYKIATDPTLCTGLKDKLAQNRSSHPLFDTVRFTGHIEQAYRIMADILRRGESPRSFGVQP